MSPISSSCWIGHSPVEPGRRQVVGQLVLTALVVAVVCQHPLAPWALVLALPLLLLMAWLEWRITMPVVALAYDPQEVVMTLADGSRWRASRTAPAICFSGWLALRAQCRGRKRWITLVSDQLPDYHWRRLSVLLRWR